MENLVFTFDVMAMLRILAMSLLCRDNKFYELMSIRGQRMFRLSGQISRGEEKIATRYATAQYLKSGTPGVRRTCDHILLLNFYRC
jgi:hypothetical protein